MKLSFTANARSPMQIPTSGRLLSVAATAALLLAPWRAAFGQSDPAYRGLWVGDVTLSYVNEVTVPLDAHNNPVAPDPRIPTPTSDAAQLRLILHVNGAGQVSLLKDVAIVSRTGGTNNPTGLAQSESDLALVTDERMYEDFPAQPAFREASAAFDFGDSRATKAVDNVMETAAAAAAASVNTNTVDLSTDAGRLSAQNAAMAAALQAAGPLVASADVAPAFNQFLTGPDFNSTVVNDIAGAADPTNAAQSALVAATNLQSRSFYADSRGIEVVNAVLAAVQSAGTGEEKTNAAQNAAASFADTANDYQRFIAGKTFGDMITGAAAAVANAATNAGASVATIMAAVSANSQVIAARGNALNLRVASFQDTRASDAVETVLDAIVQSAVNALGSPPVIEQSVRSAAESAGRSALSTNVVRYAVSSKVPTPDYNDFVRSTSATSASQAFTNSAALAAQAAAEGAVSEKVNNALYTAQSIQDAARVSAVEALRSVYSAAAQAVRTQLPLTGQFGPGQGDARLTWEHQDAADELWAPGGGALSGTIDLPASHPTNPFRHRRHPDHTVGFDITRRLRLDFDDGPADASDHAGFGVDRISGTYREEIFGLHKPLGPQKDIGLRVEGRFELNRISLIDTLNAE